MPNGPNICMYRSVADWGLAYTDTTETERGLRIGGLAYIDVTDANISMMVSNMEFSRLRLHR